MINIRKQWTYRILISMIIGCLFFSYANTVSAAVSPTNDLLNRLYDTVDKDPGQLKILISNYCSVVLWTSGFVNDGFVYNAKYSAFVHLLCSNIWQSSSYFAKSDAYFKRTTFAQLWFTDFDADGNDLCAPWSMDNSCNLSKNMPDLFNGILNDYVNIKQSSLYGDIVNYQDESDLEKNVVNPYSQDYFGLDVCDDNHLHPKTCSMVKSYVKSVRNILSDVNIFNTTGILALTPTSNIPCSDSNNPEIDIFYCGLKGSWPSMMSFVNLSYNEIFYYRLFMGYYMIMLQKYPLLLPDYTSYDTILQNFSSQYIRSKSALSLSLRMMRDTYIAFPFHIGLTLYAEDLDGFGKSLARIAPPIYTLYDKLRNVQKSE